MSRGDKIFTVASGISGLISLTIGLPASVESSAIWIVWSSALADQLGGWGVLVLFGAVTLLLGMSRYLYLQWRVYKSVPLVEHDIVPSLSDDTKAHPESNLRRPREATPSIERPHTNLKPIELIGLGKGMTSLVATGLRKPHLGKWIRVEGNVHNISQYGSGGYVVRIPIGDSYSAAHLEFDKKWGQNLETMQIGDRIRIYGKIVEIESYQLTIEECELEYYGRADNDC